MASATDTAKPESGARGQGATGRRTRPRRRFSSLTFRILALNLLALAILVAGVLYLDQYQRGLIEGRLEALATQGLIISAALAETVVPADPAAPQQINPGRAAALILPLVRPIHTRARVFGNDGTMVVDSLRLERLRAGVSIRALPPPEEPAVLEPLLDRFHKFLDRTLIGDLPTYKETPYQRAEHYAEVVRALRGRVGAQARRDADGEMVLNVAVPLRRFKAVLGALMLTAGTADIEDRVREVRGDILVLGLLAVGVTILISLYLAGTIAQPIRQLAAGAARVTSGWGGAQEIPDLSTRADEIGDLSVALRTMTEALNKRVDEIEHFAADVSHELKNPLSSLRSAIETIQRVDDQDTQRRLFAILDDDIERMDRLISDISAASRLDAEMARAVSNPIDLVAVLTALVEVRRATADEGAPEIELNIEQAGAIDIRGIEDSLVQVFRNLLDNAISFSPPGGRITVRLARRTDGAAIIVEDQGPGIPPGKTRAVFDRFYSERPEGEKFGTHSGLGLSISRLIVEAHKGTITAQNMTGHSPDDIIGARFTVVLPY
jgi:two-component system sensor histidine kinase ChvG